MVQFCFQKMLDVRTRLGSLVACSDWESLYKTGTLLDWPRVIGFAVEQALLWFVVFGSACKSVELILISGVKRRPNGPSFEIAVPLDVHHQAFIEDVADSIFAELLSRHFMCTIGVDVPYVTVGGQGSRRHHDILGTFCAGCGAEFVGLTAIEVHTTQGWLDSATVTSKKDVTLDNFKHAGPNIEHQLFCLVSYKRSPSGRLKKSGITWYRMVDSNFVPTFRQRLRNVDEDTCDQLCNRVLRKVTPRDTTSGQAVYDLRKVLDELGYSAWSGPVVTRLKHAKVKGIVRRCLKKRGGAKLGKNRRRYFWTITEAGLRKAMPHLKAKL